MERGGAVTLHGVLADVGWRLGRGGVSGVVPGECVALVGNGVASRGGSNLQIERAQRVATIYGGGEHMAVWTSVGAIVDGAFEEVLLVVADAVRYCVIVDWAHVDTHDDGGVGAGVGRYHYRVDNHGVSHGGVEGFTVPTDGQHVEADVAVEAAAGIPIDRE